MLNIFKAIVFCLLLSPCILLGNGFLLKENLAYAERGDYIVTVRNKNYTLLVIREKSADALQVEEITVPGQRYRSPTWREWMAEGAPCCTAWVSYTIDIHSGEIRNFYSRLHGQTVPLTKQENLFTRLINLPFAPVPKYRQRKKGSMWQPKMVVDGQRINNVNFSMFNTYWPNDGSELAGKLINIYLPDHSPFYPFYFPYWVEAAGMTGKAKMRVVDSGKHLQ